MKKRTKQGLALIKVQMMTALLILCANPLAAEEQKLGEGLKLKDIWDSFDVLTLQKKADQGDAGAQNNLGVRYKDGRGVEQNDEKAVYWFREAVKKRNAAAQNNLGWMYLEGRGVEQSDGQAVYWFRESAEQNNAGGQNNLGWMYQHGRSVEQNDEIAVEWYRKAAEQGDAGGQNNLGWMYSEGRGVEQNYETAVYWYRKAAEQGDDAGQYNLGKAYYEGCGIEQNKKLAFHWIRKSAEQGFAEAEFFLGDTYYVGEEEYIPQNIEEALYWLTRAAKHGHKGAKFTLFMHYLMTDEPETSEDKPADAKEGAAAPSTEETADTALLIIDKAGTLTGVTDKTKLSGTLVLSAEVKKIGKEAFRGCTGLTSMDFSACTNLAEIGERAFWNILPKVQFTVPMEAIKELLKDSKSGIKDEQITVKDTGMQ